MIYSFLVKLTLKTNKIVINNDLTNIHSTDINLT